jgi:DNA-binding SARP family transcriptional activator
MLSDRVVDPEGGLDYATQATHPVWLCLLGTFRLVRLGQEVSLRSGGKTEALLASLALAPRDGVAREVLLRRLWPESEPPLATNALNNVVYTLRGLLSDALGGAAPVVHSGGYYRLNDAAGVAVDVAQFKLLAARSAGLLRSGKAFAAAETAERAVRLYTGDLSVNFDGAQLIFERDRLRATCLGLLMQLADHAFARGNYDGCQAYALRLLEFDLCREDAHRLVMRCYVRLGERAQALRHFAMVRAVLHAEFDAEPEPATVALYEQVRVDPSAV